MQHSSGRTGSGADYGSVFYDGTIKQGYLYHHTFHFIACRVQSILLLDNEAQCFRTLWCPIILQRHQCR